MPLTCLATTGIILAWWDAPLGVRPVLGESKISSEALLAWEWVVGPRSWVLLVG